ncbi:MAG: SDR family NAD(P)-dependent oxidoreductase, partial [Pseudonocardia sediminis]
MSLAVITGAASGIGAALADTLAARGTRLVLADVDTDGLARTAARTGGTAVPTDVADPDAVQALAAAAPGARLVCLNAGIVGTALGAPWEVPAHDWDRVFAVNVGGVVNGLRAFVPPLLAAGEPAHVLVTASLAGMAVFPGGGAYGPSKHAVSAVVQHAAMALAGTPVTIGMICPALVATGISADGVPAATVAEQALDAVDAGVFAVVPPEWATAVITQVETVL